MKIDTIEKLEKFQHDADMKRLNKATLRSLIFGFAAALIIFIYISSLPNIISSEIKLSEDIPINVRIQKNTSAEGSYSAISAEPLHIRKQENISFFENEKISSFAKTSYDPKTDKIWLLIRGIEQEKLPDTFDFYREFEKPPIRSGFLYRSSDPSLVEIRGPSEPFSDSQLCNNCHSGAAPEKYKMFSIEFSRSQNFMNSASAILGGGTIMAFLAFIALMKSSNKKKT